MAGVSRPPLVWNVGLPRTGTTSTSAALRQMGLKCTPVVAHWVAQDIKHWAGFGGRTLAHDYPYPPLICSVREFDPWAHSMRHYFSRVSMDVVRTIYDDHRAWIDTLDRPVGLFAVDQGYESLHLAMSVAMRGVALPMLNTGRDRDTKAGLRAKSSGAILPAN